MMENKEKVEEKLTVGKAEIINYELRSLLSKDVGLRNLILEKTLEEAVDFLEDKLVSKMTGEYEKIADAIREKPMIHALKHILKTLLPSSLALNVERAIELNLKKAWRRISFSLILLIGVLTYCFLSGMNPRSISDFAFILLIVTIIILFVSLILLKRAHNSCS